MIFRFYISWFRRKSRRRSKATTKLERLINVTLLKAALKDPGVLVQLINKYGQIPVYQEDKEIEAKIKDLRAKINKEAVGTLLSTRHQELANRIDEIIDRVIGLNTERDR